MTPTDPIRVRDHARLSRVSPTLIQALIPLLDQFRLFVVEGVRTEAQQYARWCQGRDQWGRVLDRARVVTWCDGTRTRSHHQVHPDGYGYAVDVAFRGPVPFPPASDPRWTQVGEAAEARGLVWGGRFRAPVDLDHLELQDNPAATLAHQEIPDAPVHT